MISNAERQRQWRARNPSPLRAKPEHKDEDHACLRFILPVQVHRGPERERERRILPADVGEGVKCQSIIYVSNGKPAPGVDASILDRANRSAEFREYARPRTMHLVDNPRRNPKSRKDRKTPASIALGDRGRRTDVTPEVCRALVAKGLTPWKVSERLRVSVRTVYARLRETEES